MLLLAAQQSVNMDTGQFFWGLVILGIVFGLMNIEAVARFPKRKPPPQQKKDTQKKEGGND